MNILGIGTAIPPHSITQSHAAELAIERCCDSSQQARWLRRAYETAGVTQRHSELLAPADGNPRYIDLFPPRREIGDRGPSTGRRMEFYALHAGPLAARAAQAALADAGIGPRAVTHLITASCTGFAAPGLDFSLIRNLGLSPGVSRLHVGFMGCHAAMNAMEAAQAFTRADHSACVMICAVELCTLHFQYGWDPDAVLANALFADGAAAMVVSNHCGSRRPIETSKGQADLPLCIAATGSMLFPDSETAMGWQIGDHGFVMTLSRDVPDLIESRLRPFLSEWLGQLEIAIDEVHSWAIHPGGPRILTAVEKALELSPSSTRASREVLGECGNMSSPTIVFVLRRLWRTKAPRPIVALGFGPGLVVHAALLR